MDTVGIALSSPDIEPYPRPEGDLFDITAHRKWFSRYAAAERALCDRDPGPLDLKTRHTYKVLDNALFIVRAEGFAPPMARACLLAALYHDIARFEQYRIWNTFRDKESCSHGELGARILTNLGVLRHEPALAPTVIRAVALHNVLALPEGLPRDVRAVTQVVRDADKIDILRVMDEHLSSTEPYSPTVVLSRPDTPDLFSAKVIADVEAGRVASYDDLESVNDFRLLLGGWVNGLSYSASRRRMALDGHAFRLVAALPADGVYASARGKVLAELESLLAGGDAAQGTGRAAG